jgi:hypothetical protein
MSWPVAELASAMIGADLALPVDHLDDHASYIAMRLKPPRRAFFVHLDEISLYRSFERIRSWQLPLLPAQTTMNGS